MTPKTETKWLFDKNIIGDYIIACDANEADWIELHLYIQSEIERNRREAVREFAEKILTKRDGEFCRCQGCRYHDRIKAALKEMDA